MRNTGPDTSNGQGGVKLPILFSVVAAAFAVIVGLLAHLQNDRENWVRHTLQVQNALNGLDGWVNRAEAVQRGYLLTGQDNFLGIYDRSRAKISGQLTALQSLTADNPTQGAALSALRQAVQLKLQELNDAIARRKAGQIDAANASLRDGSTRTLARNVSRALDRMRGAETQLLSERTRDSEWLNLALWSAAAAVGLLVLGFAGLWVAQARRSERALATAYRELSATNNELVAEMASRTAAESQVRQLQKMEAVGQLTGGIAHDFNNMLAVVIGSLNMIQRRLAQGDVAISGFVDSAMEGAHRAAALTSRLLAFARQQPLAPQPIEANRLVSGMSELLTRTLGETIAVETVLGAGLWRTEADSAQLESALVNLAVNARDAMPAGGRLTIETANTRLDEAYAGAATVSPGQYVMIAVSDTGIGMSGDILEKAVDPFFTTKPVGKGTGLGLSQVYGFVKQSGGHLRIYSEPGQGTTVKIYLPRLLAAGAPVLDERRPVPAAEAAGDRKVMVVEDDERVRAFVEEALRDLGYRAVSVENAAAALARLRCEPDVDLLLTDIVMPEINGRQLVEQARGIRPGLSVLYMTGFTRDAVVRNGMLDPGVNFIAKPFTVDQLAAKVREALETAG